MNEEILKVVLKAIPQLGATAVLIVWLWSVQGELDIVKSKLYDCLEHQYNIRKTETPYGETLNKLTAVLPKNEFKIK